ncbi:MAG: VWA domain-containing protein [Labilithrix sp.]|nr:VWA domain-containing protein [Labilithrix sp.]MCW5813215.1 VWA domain-containing protein [Labilithrix sp.]
MKLRDLKAKLRALPQTLRSMTREDLKRHALSLVRPRTAVLLLALLAITAGAIGLRSRGGATATIGGLETTVGDLRSLHADVSVQGKAALGDTRLRDGDDVKTGPEGRARMRLDDGTVVIVAGDTELTLKGQKLLLAKGRLFVQAGTSSRTEVAIKDASATVVSSAAAFDAGDGKGKASVYCARGEVIVATGGKSTHAASGETATIEGANVKVAPETAFDDWTGGLAVPWSGEKAPASAIAELWAGSGETDPGAPLVVRSQKVNVTVEGELAVTRMRTSYFNGSDRELRADVRLALPEGAVVSRVARCDEGRIEFLASMEIAKDAGTIANGSSRLEWAGGGWLRGALMGIEAGKSVDLLIDYVEWLPQKNGRATYRFPMASEIEAPMVGGLEVKVSSLAPAKWLSASTGAAIVNGAIELRRADIRPTGDLVVELLPAVVKADAARAYVERPNDGKEDPYVVVRTEVPDVGESGVALALVVDTSSSVGPALLETERAAVDAILESMGPKDSVVVVAADQNAVMVGPDKLSPVTTELRAQIRKDMTQLRSGGASNLGVALERAADLLDAADAKTAPASPGKNPGMVVYLGDGRPTVGESTGRDLRRRLGLRANGAPRLGALAIGQGADRWLLAELVSGAGPVFDVLDRPDAARAASALVAEALAPTIRDVSLVLGATIDRVYPRDARAVPAGTTLTVAGRLRGALPDKISIRYRQGTEVVEKIIPLEEVKLPQDADVAKRWTALRIEETISRDDGIEPAIALAAKSRLLTPWTVWSWYGASASTPFADRILGLSPRTDAAYAGRVQPAPQPPSLLLEPPAVFDGEATIEQAAEIAARHNLENNMSAMVACRDARASIKPSVTGDLKIDVSVNADGKATKVTVTSSRPGEDDPILDRCIKVVVGSMPFFDAGVAFNFSHVISLPPAPSSRRTECSVASTLPLAVRRGIWRARKARGQLDYGTAAHSCELPTWSDRRTLLGIMALGMNAQTGTALAKSLSAQGETDAAAFVKQELLLHTSLTALGYEELRRLLIDDEPKVDRALDKAFRAAKNDEAREKVLRRFLRLAPHSPLGRRLLLGMLENKNDRGGLLDAIEQIRSDVFADAGLLAECASALRRIGEDAEGRRAFGDLIERAPRDPWTLGYVGDRLRAEGLYEDAALAYLRLDAAMPDDPAVTLRLALAHAGAGRLDVATRLLDRVAQTGGRGDDGRLGELASVVAASLLANAREDKPSPETDALLVRRLAQTPLPDVASIILVRTPLTDDKVEVSIARNVKDKDELPADLDASAMGLSALRIERGGGTARIRIKRTGAVSARTTKGLVTALVLGSDRAKAKLVTREVDIGGTDKGTELRWTGEAFE